MAAVSIRDVRKSFAATQVLRGVSLDIADGEFLVLVGPSGCGKSTLLRIIAGLEAQTAGEIAIGGRCVDAQRPKERDVAMVFQSYALYPYMTVAANMALPLVMRRLNTWQRLPIVGGILPGTRHRRATIAGEVEATARLLDIGHLLDRKPAQLSGGQRQRVAVGRAMVRHPQVFLMDEPLSNLDAKLRVQMRAEIAELHRRLGATFIYVTHDQAEAMTMADRVAVMLDGELLQVAPPRAVYADPDDLRVAEFIGSPKINVLPAVVRGDGGLDVCGAVLPLRTGLVADTHVRLGVRPEGFALGEGRGALHGTVRHVEDLGADLMAHIEVASAVRVVMRVDPADAPTLRLGGSVAMRPLPEHALLFDQAGRRLRYELVVHLREVAHG